MFRRILSLFRSIDRVQHQVDELIDTLDDSSDTSRDFYRQYEMSRRQCVRLGVMILKQQDNCLPMRQQRRLKKQVYAQLGAARYYFEFQELTLMLYAYYHPTLSCPCLQELFGPPSHPSEH